MLNQIYAVVFIRGNDRLSVQDNVQKLLEYVFEHGIHNPLTHLLDDVPISEKEINHINVYTQQVLLQCNRDAWSMLCISKRVIQHLVLCRSTYEVYDAIKEDDQLVSTELFWILNPQTFWKKYMIDKQQHDEERECDVYVSSFYSYPNSFTPYIDSICRQNTTTQFSVRCLTNNVKHLDKFFNSWFRKYVQPVFTQTRQQFRKIQNMFSTHPQDKVKAEEKIRMYKEGYSLLLTEFTDVLFNVRKNYDQFFLTACMKSILTMGFFTFVYVDVLEIDPVRNTVHDEHGQRIYLPNDIYRILIQYKQSILLNQKYNDLAEKVIEHFQHLLDICTNKKDREEMISYIQTCQHIRCLFAAQSLWKVPIHVVPHTILRHGLTKVYYACDHHGNRLRMVLGNENSGNDQNLPPYDIQSPLSSVLNRYMYIEEIVKNVGLSFKFESKPIVFCKKRKPDGATKGHNKDKDDDEYFLRRKQGHLDLLEFDSKLNHMEIERLNHENTFKKSIEDSYRNIVKRIDVQMKKVKEGDDNMSLNDSSFLDATISNAHDSMLKQFQRADHQYKLHDKQSSDWYMSMTSTNKPKSQSSKLTTAASSTDTNVPVEQSLNKRSQSIVHKLIKTTNFERSINDSAKLILECLKRQLPSDHFGLDLIDSFNRVTSMFQKDDDNQYVSRAALLDLNLKLSKQLDKSHVKEDNHHKRQKTSLSSSVSSKLKSEIMQGELWSTSQAAASENEEKRTAQKEPFLSFDDDHESLRIQTLTNQYSHLPKSTIRQAVYQNPSALVINHQNKYCSCDDDPCECEIGLESIPQLSRVDVVKYMETLDSDIVLAITGRQAATNRQEIIKGGYASTGTFRTEDGTTETATVPQTEDVQNRAFDLIEHILVSVFGPPLDINLSFSNLTHQPNIYIAELKRNRTINPTLTTSDVFNWLHYVREDDRRHFIANYLNVKLSTIDIPSTYDDQKLFMLQSANSGNQRKTNYDTHNADEDSYVYNRLRNNVTDAQS